MLHLNLTFGETHDGKCRECKSETVLVVATDWHAHPVAESGPDDFVEIATEVSGHFCPKCCDLVALFLNRRTAAPTEE